MSPRTVPAGTPLGDDFHVFDTTLRDGAQREGISYSVADKLAVARHLDALGVGYIEGGWPGAMPKDTEFFARAAAGELTLRHAALVAFGATRKAGTTRRSRPPGPRPARRAGAGRHARREVRPPPHRARAAHRRRPRTARWSPTPSRSCGREGRRVFLDAEHFFDGYRFDPDTALRVLDAAVTAGADVAVLCDTNGGMLPLGIAEVVTQVSGPHRVPARHPLPGRHRVRGRQLRRRGAGGRDARAVHRQRLRGAGRQRRPVRRRREPRDQARHARAPARRARRADPDLARVGGDRQHRPRHPPGLCRGRSVRPQGGPARECDQGRPGAVQPHGPCGRRQRAAGAGHGDGRPGQRRAQGCRARPGPGRPSRRRVERRRHGQGAGGAGVVVRGGRRVAGAAHALGARGRRRGGAPVHARVVSRADREPRRRGRQRGDGQARRRRRADHRDARGQRPGQRAGRRSARGAHAVAAVARGRRAVGLQGPPPRAAGRGRRAGRTPSPGCSSSRPTARARGRRSACTATSSRRPGWRWSTPWRTRDCAATPRWAPFADDGVRGLRGGTSPGGAPAPASAPPGGCRHPAGAANQR